jgi:hypothetical protein
VSAPHSGGDSLTARAVDATIAAPDFARVFHAAAMQPALVIQDGD